MKKSNKIAITIMIVLVAGILLSIPFSIFFDKEAMASSNITNKQTLDNTFDDASGEDYIFVVLDEVKVPLAAIPGKQSYSNYVIVAVIVSLLFVSLLSYIYWYLAVAKNISHYSKLVSKSALSSIVPANSFLHPKKFAYAEREIESLAAKHFI